MLISSASTSGGPGKGPCNRKRLLATYRVSASGAVQRILYENEIVSLHFRTESVADSVTKFDIRIEVLFTKVFCRFGAVTHRSDKSICL